MIYRFYLHPFFLILTVDRVCIWSFVFFLSDIQLLGLIDNGAVLNIQISIGRNDVTSFFYSFVLCALDDDEMSPQYAAVIQVQHLPIT